MEDVDRLQLIDYRLLVSKYSIYEVIKLFVRDDDYLHFDHWNLRIKNVHDRILHGIQLSKISIEFTNIFHSNLLHLIGISVVH